MVEKGIQFPYIYGRDRRQVEQTCLVFSSASGMYRWKATAKEEKEETGQ